MLGAGAVSATTRKDRSFLRGLLLYGGFAAMAFIVVAPLTGLTLGTFCARALRALAGGYLVHDTSNVLHHYRTDQHQPRGVVARRAMGGDEDVVDVPLEDVDRHGASLRRADLAARGPAASEPSSRVLRTSSRRA